MPKYSTQDRPARQAAGAALPAGSAISPRMRERIRGLQDALAQVADALDAHQLTLAQLVASVVAIVDAHDVEVTGHSQRVATYAVALGRELMLAAEELDELRIAALLHDVGKLAIPTAILRKAAPLTTDEYAEVKQHATIGEHLLAGVPALHAVARIVGEHHEHYNGAGYPAGREGQAISLSGRILAVADALDSILSRRPYAAARRLAWALAEFDRCRGTQFDPAVVAALHRLVAARGLAFFTSTSQAAPPDRAWPPGAIPSHEHHA